MCEICGQDPCHPRCPNAPEPKEVHICSECLEGIYPGDRFYESCGSYVCEECLKGMDEEAYSIDDELRERIVKGVENALLEKATNEAVKAVDNKIAEKILEAEETIQATVDQFIANVCEEKIGKIVIPEKKSTWSDEVTYKPLSEYVGERFELFLTEKRYDRDGRIASYSSDRKLSAAGLLTSQYLEEELGKKVEKLIANAKREVEESLIKSLEQNLKENLAKDTIERMNIPEVLKKLSSIGAKQVTGTSLPE